MSSSLILKQNLSYFPFCKMILIDFAGLNFILDHEIMCPRSSNIHLPSGTDLALTVMSSMKALVGGCRIPEIVTGPRLIFYAVLTIKFIAAEKRMTEMVHPVTIPTSRRCHDACSLTLCSASCNCQSSVSTVSETSKGTWYFFSIRSTSLCGTVPYALAKSNHKTVRSPLVVFASLMS